MNILILSTGKPSSHLIEAIESKGHTYKHLYPNYIYCHLSDSEKGYDRVYYATPEHDQPERILMKDFNAIITRIGNDLLFSSNVLMQLNENLGIYSPQTAQGLLNASDKLRTLQLCSVDGLRVPRTQYAKNPIHIKFLIDKIGGLPAIAKTVKGSQGKGVFILRDEEQTNTSLEAIYNMQVDLILQEYIEGGKRDIRAIVVGNKVVAAMERQGNKDFRANLSQDGTGRKVELSKDDQEFCIKAAQSVGLEFAGVDIMKSTTNGKTYLIEVNGNPGTKSIKVTGVNWFKHLVEHIEERVKNGGGKAQIENSALINVINKVNLTGSSLPNLFIAATNQEPQKKKWITAMDVITGKWNK